MVELVVYIYRRAVDLGRTLDFGGQAGFGLLFLRLSLLSVLLAQLWKLAAPFPPLPRNIPDGTELHACAVKTHNYLTRAF